jgi:hypothetical protein
MLKRIVKLIRKEIRLDIDLKSTLIFVFSDINNKINVQLTKRDIAGYINRSF